MTGESIDSSQVQQGLENLGRRLTLRTGVKVRLEDIQTILKKLEVGWRGYSHAEIIFPEDLF